MILQYPHDILAKIASPIEDKLMLGMLLPAFKQSVDKHSKGALGLAAPQIGLSYQMIWLKGFGYLINPKIIDHSETKIGAVESCLSVPGKFYTVERYKTVKVLYRDEQFKLRRHLFTDTLSIVVQHELCHALDGLCLPQYGVEINTIEDEETNVES